LTYDFFWGYNGVRRAAYERMLKLEDIDKEIRDVQKRMLRFIETGDLKSWLN